MKEYTFHLATFILRSALVNWHNSRQGYNLEELVTQSELAHDLVSNKRDQELMRRVVNIVTCFFHAKIDMFRGKVL
jgi:hypothetical protein